MIICIPVPISFLTQKGHKNIFLNDIGRDGDTYDHSLQLHYTIPIYPPSFRLLYIGIYNQFLLKLKASLGGSYARFEAMSSLDKYSFVLGNELCFESLLALVKAYIIDMGGTKI